jgi:hypothetical protein
MVRLLDGALAPDPTAAGEDAGRAVPWPTCRPAARVPAPRGPACPCPASCRPQERRTTAELSVPHGVTLSILIGVRSC